MTRRVVGEAAVRVGADIGPLKLNLNDGARAVRGFSGRVKRSAGDLVKNLRNVGLAASAMSAAITAGTRSAVRGLDNIAKTADKIGLTTDALQELRFAGELSGVAARTLDMAMQRFTRRVAEARQGTGEAKAALEEMGIALTDSEGRARDTTEVLADVADKMEGMRDQSDRVRIAMKLFDSEGVAMVNMLADGSRALQGMRDQARDTGAVIEEELIRRAEDVQDEFDAATMALSAQFKAALVELSPILIGVANVANDLARSIRSLTEDITGFYATFTEKLRPLKKELDALRGIDDPNAPTADRNTNAPGPGSADVPRGSGAGVLLLSPDELAGGLSPDDPRVTGINPITPEADASRSGGGRGRFSGPTEEDVMRMRDQFMTMREAMQEEYAADLERLEEFRRAKLIKGEEFNDMEERVHEEHTRRLRQIDRLRNQQRLSDISSAFSDLSSLMSSGSKKLFRIGKAAAIAQAVVEGYSAAVSAWQKGMTIGGPPVAAAFTAASLAKTGALISSIKAQSATGGSGAQNNPGGGGSSGSVAPEEERRISREITVNLRGGLAGQAGGIRDIIGAINEELGDGADLRVNIGTASG